MKLKDYIKKLNTMADKYPNAIVLTCGHEELMGDPELGKFTEYSKMNGGFNPNCDEKEINAVVLEKIYY